MEGKLYYESQTVMPAWLSAITAIMCVGLSIFMIYLLSGDDVAADSAAGIVLLVSIVMTLVLSFVLFVIRIKTTVTRTSLRVGLLKGRLVLIEDIESVSAEEFSAFKDFLGWGFRIGKKGVGYIAAGTNKGLRIHLRTGKSFLISTKRIFEFENIMKMALKNVRK